jgi:hypothetical protein
MCSRRHIFVVVKTFQQPSVSDMHSCMHRLAIHALLNAKVSFHTHMFPQASFVVVGELCQPLHHQDAGHKCHTPPFHHDNGVRKGSAMID